MNRRVSLGFAVLCLLWGSQWLLDLTLPGRWSGLQESAMHQLILAVLFAAVSLGKGQRTVVPRRVVLELVGGGLFLSALPQIVLVAAAGAVTGYTSAFAFLLVPVFVVLLAGQGSAGFGAGDNPQRHLVPALVGLAGAALLIPFAWPATVAGRLWLGLIVVLAALAALVAVRLHRMLRGVPVLLAASILYAASGLVLAGMSLEHWVVAGRWMLAQAGTELVRGLGFDAPVLLLTVWLLREIPPVRFSARTILIPLVAMLESLALLRPPTVWTTWIGLALLAGGGFALLRADSREML